METTQTVSESKARRSNGASSNLIENDKNSKQHHENKKLSRMVSVSNAKQIEIWSKTARKMLESILKKAILNNNLIKLNKINELFEENESKSNKLNKLLLKNSPPATSTLKRSSDIKLNLSKLLDKKAYELLTNISGANIKHNSTHINKHGVVINTDDDLPPWLVKAMTSLLMWEAENDCGEEQFPKFEDVFNEVVNYFNDLSEPLLSKDLSHLFMQILRLLVVPQSAQTPKLAHKSSFDLEKPKIIKKSTSFELSKLEEFLPKYVNENSESNMLPEALLMSSAASLSSNIQNLLSILKEQLSHNTHSHDFRSGCMSHQLLDVIANISTSEASLSGARKENPSDFFEQMEAKLLENAKLELDQMDYESSTSAAETLNLNELSHEQKETLQNLLLASVAKLEHCCEDCLSTYNEINDYINSKALEFNEFNEYLSNLNNYEYLLNQQMEANGEFGYNENDFEYDNGGNLNEEYATANMTQFFRPNSLYGSSDQRQFKSLNHLQVNADDELKEKLDHDELIKPANKMLKSVSDRKLRRNNSFRAAIGEIQLSKETPTEVEMAPPGPLPSLKSNLVRRQTSSNTNDFQRSRISHSASLFMSHGCSGEPSDDFNFKRPRPVGSSSDLLANPFSKSISMNFSIVNADSDESLIRSDMKKRKASLSNSSNSLSKPCSKINRNESIPRNYEHQNKLISGLRATSTNSIDKTGQIKPDLSSLFLLNKIIPSLSLSALNQFDSGDVNMIKQNLDYIQNYSAQNTHKFLNNYSSLRNLTSNISKSKSVNASLNELSSFIKSSITSKNVIEQAKTNVETFVPNKAKLVLNLSTELDSDIFPFIISSFRLCALMLPPTNKRKLHLLLRFLNKLKYNKHSAKYLIQSHEDLHAQMFNNYEDLNFIDSSAVTTNNSLNFSGTNPAIELAHAQNSHKKKKRNSTLKADLENKSAAIENVIIKAFLNTIVYIESKKNESGDENRNEDVEVDDKSLAEKLVQILINNYTEIMRIPDELLINVKQKLNTIKEKNAETESSSGIPKSLTTSSCTNLQNGSTANKINSNRYVSKISLQQYDKQKSELSKQQLTGLLNSILTNTNMKEEEKLQRLKKFKEAHPLIYEEKYPTIKKALNILGIDDSMAYLNVTSFKNPSKDDLEFIKKKAFLSGLGDSSKKSNIFSNKMGAISSGGINLNRTSIASNSSSKNSMSSMLQATSSIAFPKFFLNKKKKESQN